MSGNGLNPHGFCLLWRSDLLTLHIASDALIGISYFSIPAALTYFITKRRDIEFSWVVLLFAAFILACGSTHFFSIWTLWHADYGREGVLKAFTALVSVTTAAALWPLMPRALALPSTSQLKASNHALEINIAQREVAHHSLQQSEARFRDLYHKTPVPLQSRDANGCITLVNDYWIALLGYTKEEVIGRHFSMFHTPDSAVRLNKAWPDFLATGLILNAPHQVVKKNGEVLEVLISSHLTRDAGGNFETSYSVLVDITAQYQAEERLRQAQKMEAVGQLTGGVAHDFNNLLTGVLGNLDLLEAKIAEPAQRQLVLSAIRSAERGAKLTSQLLALARQQRLEASAVNINEAIRSIDDLLASTLGAVIKIEENLTQPLSAALIDRTQLELLILNLAINARDAMPDGGTLTISTRQRRVGPDNKLELASGDYVTLSIADTGTGMSPDVLARAFEPFFTTKEIGKGSGLGLSQVYGVARQSGGAVEIQSALGKGTTVELYLPCANIDHRQQTEAEPVLKSSGRAQNIMIVDDDDDVREYLKNALQEMGHRVSTAGNGTEALQMLSEQKYDLIISDFAMPEMTGSELLRKIRTLRPGVRSVLMTGYTEVVDFDELTEGITLLRKPFRKADLAQIIENIP